MRFFLKKVKESVRIDIVITLMALGLVLLFFHNSIVDGILALSRLSRHDPIYKLSALLYNFVIFAGWILLFVAVIRNQIYRAYTGRNCSSDVKRYNRNIYDLISFFKDAEQHKLDTSNFPVMNWKFAKGLVFGMDKNRLITIPSNSECNIAIYGPPRSREE